METTREIRALTIAATTMLRPSKTGWTVPSQSGGSNYRVSPDVKTCSCPDHETRAVGVSTFSLSSSRFAARRARAGRTS